MGGGEDAPCSAQAAGWDTRRSEQGGWDGCREHVGLILTAIKTPECDVATSRPEDITDHLI